MECKTTWRILAINWHESWSTVCYTSVLLCWTQYSFQTLTYNCKGGLNMPEKVYSPQHSSLAFFFSLYIYIVKRSNKEVRRKFLKIFHLIVLKLGFNTIGFFVTLHKIFTRKTCICGEIQLNAHSKLTDLLYRLVWRLQLQLVLTLKI